PAGFRLAPTPALLDPQLPELDEPEAAEPPAEPAQQAPAPEVPAQPEATPSTPNAGEATSAPEAPEASDEPDEDTGPPTQAVSAVHLGIGAPEGVSEEEDPFLDELRKAMSDEEPLGPRDGSTDHVPGASLFGEDDDRRGWRFGKRR